MPKRKLLDSWIDHGRLSELFAGLRGPGVVADSGLQIPEEAIADRGSRIADWEESKKWAEPEPPLEPNADKTEPVPESSGRKAINPLTLYFPPPTGSLEKRARALIDWAKEITGSTDGFVVDAYGAVIAKDAGLDDVLLASVSNLADGLGRGMAHFSRSGQGALQLELAEGTILCLIQSKWGASTVALGLIGAAGLDRDVADRLRVELGRLDRKRRERD